MLRKLRITLAIIMILMVTLLFVGVGYGVSHWAGWAAKIQFIPALLSLPYIITVVILLVAATFGRIYCSVICPLGIMQDFYSWLGGKFKKNRFSYVKEHKWLRYTICVIFFICLFIGIAPVTTLLDPYGNYGRIVTSFYMRNITISIIAWVVMLVLGVLAFLYGRAYCNSICPVGTILGLFAKYAPFRVRFDESKCKHCGLCEKNCKSRAIDSKAGTVDTTRCVVCGDCLAQCKFDALHYTSKKHVNSQVAPQSSAPSNDTPDQGRRSFLVGAALATATAATAQAQMKVDGGLAVIEDKKAPKRQTPLTPPGSVSAKHMQKNCTACQLCVSACPNHVLRPSTDLMHFMQPTMSYEVGYCRPECTRCGEVCPSGAIKPISKEEKTAIHVGHAVWIKDNCVVLTDGVSCGNCARHCPTAAIQMVEYQHNGQTVMVPAVNESRCIGCGACENLCPSRPFSAIYVEGNMMHHKD
ncbi:MAG: 4Fe-4S dicluster domain-containing protein [Bacteroidales bacterium]|nr:4Fe-4S dicluster domain-containing protein [Bacteroidales bacterium]